MRLQRGESVSASDAETTGAAVTAELIPANCADDLSGTRMIFQPELSGAAVRWIAVIIGVAMSLSLFIKLG